MGTALGWGGSERQGVLLRPNWQQEAMRKRASPQMCLEMMSLEVDYSTLNKTRDYWLLQQLSNLS